MTNDEAIRILKNAAWIGSNDEREAIEEAVNMAVDVLRECDKCAKASINAITSLQNAIEVLGSSKCCEGCGHYDTCRNRKRG